MRSERDERGGGSERGGASDDARYERLHEPFEPPEGFDLRAYAERSFGVFQEEPTLVVRFRAGGLLEMAWHLFTWGPDVEVLHPPELRERLTALLSEALAAHRPRMRRAERVAPDEVPSPRSGGAEG